MDDERAVGILIHVIAMERRMNYFSEIVPNRTDAWFFFLLS